MYCSQMHLEDMAEIVQRYEQSIVDFEENGVSEITIRERWCHYGECCSLCDSAQTHYPPECEGCLLAPMCDDSGVDYEAGSTYDAMCSAARGIRRLIPALKNRLAWILKRMDENGYEIVEKGVANE